MTTDSIDRADAIALDTAAPLRELRDRFLLPPGRDGRPKAYLAGNSLGAQPITARAAVLERLDAWAELAVDGWFAPGRSWIDVERELAGRHGPPGRRRAR